MTGVCVTVTPRKEAELERLTAAILGWVQLLHAKGVSPERFYEAVDIIGRNARLQAQLIEDILDISRIINGKLETNAPCCRCRD
jgi:signal transduction histidine kinase